MKGEVLSVPPVGSTDGRWKVVKTGGCLGSTKLISDISLEQGPGDCMHMYVAPQ